jgi:hypothetical protein
MNLFASLVDRAFGRAPVLQRRRPTAFEPAKNAVLATRENTFDSLREEQSFAEVETPAPREVSKVGDNRTDESRVKSPPESSNATVIPQATDITIVEEQPAFKASAPKTNEKAGDLPIREQSLTQDTRQELPKPSPTSSLAPSLETIVETNPETQVVLQKPGEEKPFDEIDLVADAPQDVPASIVNNIVVLRSIAQKQTADQIEETRLLKPVTQRRHTRQQMQRSTRERAQPAAEHLDAAMPPTINVTIGRVEVRASAPAKRAESTRQTGPKLSLEEYLRGRRGK